jgi:hypothetical protein
MTELMIRLNALANGCAEYIFAPIAILPGWLSATLVAVVTGVFMLVVFKYTSKQSSVKHVRNSIKANLFALSLFKDSMAVSLRCQARVLWGAFRLLLLAIVPMLVMTVPMCLLLAQLALWYHARPLRVGEETVLTVKVSNRSPEVPELPEVRLEPATGAKTTIGPVQVPSKHMVCWNLRAEEDGYHQLALNVGGQTFEKELAVGDGFMRVSLRRPALSWTEALFHPREAPFAGDSIVESIEVDYPDRVAWTCGTGSWLIYWFVASVAAAFCARPWFKVNI